MAPKVELYTMLACRELQPDIFHGGTLSNVHASWTIPDSPVPLLSSLIAAASSQRMEAMTGPSSCFTDPTVQAAVAKLSAGESTTVW